MGRELLVREYLSPRATVVVNDTPLPEVHRKLSRARLSSAPVVDAAGEAVGLVSLSDLLRVGGREPGDAFGERMVQLPDMSVSEVMTRDPFTIEAGSTVRRAARLMLKHRVRQLMVVDGESLRGVVTARDIARAVADSDKATPVSEYMSEPVETVDVRTRLRTAIDRLDSRRHALVVTRDGKPAGAFTQVHALRARHLVDDHVVEEHMTDNVVPVADSETIALAAARFTTTHAALVVVLWGGLRLGGVLTSTDFLYAAL